MSKFGNWYIRNQDAISWFIIGFLFGGFLDSLARGQYVWAMIQALLAAANYWFTKKPIA